MITGWLELATPVVFCVDDILVAVIISMSVSDPESLLYAGGRDLDD